MKPIPYSRQQISRADIRAVAGVLKSDWITQGPKIAQFEAALCEYTGARYAVCVSSGTAALHIAALAAGIKENDEVITSPVTFVASANCILYCAAKPVFADVFTDTVNISPERIKERITAGTRAVIPVHFAGHPCDLEEIRDIGMRRKLVIIEDASHALGAEYKGGRIGSCKHSDMTVFSFHPAKHITAGEGGAVLANRKDLYDNLLMLRNHGITKDPDKLSRQEGGWYYEMQTLGFNYRVTDFQCALGLSQLGRLGDFLEQRREIALTYHRCLSGREDIILPVERPGVKSSWHLYPIRLRQKEKRKAVFGRMREAGIGVQVHYIPLHLQPYYSGKFGYKRGDYPVSEAYYEAAFSLPLYPAMKKRDIKRVISALFKSLKS